jgi:uncharacterized protein
MRNLERIDRFDNAYYQRKVTIHTVFSPPHHYRELVRFFESEPLFSGPFHNFSVGNVESPEIALSNVRPRPGDGAEINELRKEYLDLARRGELNSLDGRLRHRFLVKMCDSWYLHLFRRILRSDATLQEVSPGGICMPGRRRLYVRPDGDFFPCERVPETEALCIGNCRDGVDVDKCYRLCQEFVEMLADDCRQCWAVLICDQNCFRDAHVGGGPSPEKKRQECGNLRLRKSQALADICSVLEENPNGLDHLNDYVVS